MKIKLIKHRVIKDNRGYFEKDYVDSQELPEGFVLRENFYTHSVKGVIRAIHFQQVEEQAKIVRCLKGKIFDVIVDLRIDSPDFGQWSSVMLEEGDGTSIFVPRGFGHGYLVIEDAVVSYKCDEYFYSEGDSAILWDDPELNIDWPTDLINNEIILSEKDRRAQSFQEFKLQ